MTGRGTSGGGRAGSGAGIGGGRAGSGAGIAVPGG
jgi:hypothetical protein